MSPRLRIAVFVALVSVALASAAGVWAANRGSNVQGKLIEGKRLYRTYCGQCHALASALAAGFGAQNKFGQDGGPSFDDLKVSASLCIIAITEQFGGHEVIVKKMNWTQIHQVSNFVQAATIHHPTVAKISDG